MALQCSVRLIHADADAQQKPTVSPVADAAIATTALAPVQVLHGGGIECDDDGAECRTPLPVVRPRSQQQADDHILTLLSATRWASIPYQSPFRGEGTTTFIASSHSSSRPQRRHCSGFLSGLYTAACEHAKRAKVWRSGMAKPSAERLAFRWSSHVVDIMAQLYVWKARACVVFATAHVAALVSAAAAAVDPQPTTCVPFQDILVAWIIALSLLEAAGAATAYRVVALLDSMAFQRCQQRAAVLQCVYTSLPATFLRIVTLMATTVTVTGTWLFAAGASSTSSHPSVCAEVRTAGHLSGRVVRTYARGILFVFFACILFHGAAVAASLFGLSYTCFGPVSKRAKSKKTEQPSPS